MANNYFKAKKGLNIEPGTSAGTAAGDLRPDSAASNKLKYHNGSSEDIVPTAASTDTLTNKTIVAASNTITTAASGNLTSTELDAALAELQTDIDTRATSSDLTTHTSATAAHGVSGAVVGTTDAQSLTNKTIDADLNTITNIEDADIKAGAAIARAKLSSGTADHVIINDGSGNFSSEAQLAKSRGGAGADMSSVTFPTTGTIATRAAVEDLSGKTFTDPITLEEQGSTPSNPSAGDRKLYAKTDGKLYHLDSSGLETQVGAGAGGGVNYHDDFDCDNISKVSTYDDVTAATDGTGGTPNVTASSETSSPIAGTASYKLTKDAADRQHEGWAIDSDTLDSVDTAAGNAIWVDFYYKTSANYVADDVEMYVYRVGSNTLEALNTFQGSSFTNGLPAAPNGARYSGWVTPSSTDTSLRLMFHQASTNANAVDIYVDRLSIGPKAQVQTAIQSNPEAYTPTNTQGLGTISSVDLKWHREGAFMIIQGAFTTGTVTASTAQLELPTGFTIGGTASAKNHVGYITRAGAAGPYTLLATQGNTYLTIGGGASSHGDAAGNALFTSSEALKLFAVKIPISGWSSGNAMSTAELSVRSVFVEYTSNAAQSIPNVTYTIIDYEDLVNDSHSAVTVGGSWKFTAPSAGYYDVSAGILLDASTAWAESEPATLAVFKNGTQHRTLDHLVGLDSSGGSSFKGVSGAATIKLNKGDYIDIRIYQGSGGALNTYTDSNFNFVSITGRPDLSVIGVQGVNEVKDSGSNTYTNWTGGAGTWTNVTSISLEPGTWDLSGAVGIKQNGAGTTANAFVAISAYSATTTTDHYAPKNMALKELSGTSSVENSLVVAPFALTLSATTTIYLKGYMVSATNKQYIYYLRARRIQ